MENYAFITYICPKCVSLDTPAALVATCRSAHFCSTVTSHSAVAEEEEEEPGPCVTPWKSSPVMTPFNKASLIKGLT